MPKCGTGWNEVQCPACVPRPWLRRSKRFPVPERDPVSLGTRKHVPALTSGPAQLQRKNGGAGGGGQGVPPRDPLLGPQASSFAFLCNPYRTRGYLQLLSLSFSIREQASPGYRLLTPPCLQPTARTECSMSLLDRRYVLVGGREEQGIG